MSNYSEMEINYYEEGLHDRIQELEAENERLRKAITLVEDLGFPDFWYEPIIYSGDADEPELPIDLFRKLTI